MAGVVIAPWLNPPDFIGAARAGAQIGLSEAEMRQQAEEHAAELALKRDQLAVEMSQAEAERSQKQQEQNAALALRQAALQQQGLLGRGRLENQSNEISERDALERARIDAANKKGIFVNTGNGLFQKDPVTGAWSQVPNTSSPKPLPDDFVTVSDKNTGVSRKYPAVAYDTWKKAVDDWSKKKDSATVPGTFWGTNPDPNFEKNNPAPKIEDFLKTSTQIQQPSAADALTKAQNVLPDFGTPIASTSTNQFTKGQRAVQDGTTYEFDGTTWNEVKE